MILFLLALVIPPLIPLVLFPKLKNWRFFVDWLLEICFFLKIFWRWPKKENWRWREDIRLLLEVYYCFFF